MAVQGNAMSLEMGHRPIIPMVGMGMSQNQGLDSGPGGSHRLESGSQLTRSQTGINQEPKRTDLQKAGVAAATAGKN
jgi:hypothetical protein